MRQPTADAAIKSKPLKHFRNLGTEVVVTVMAFLNGIR